MKVKDHELASSLIKGERVEYPPSKAYARLVDPAPKGGDAPASVGTRAALARIWVLPQKRGGVRINAAHRIARAAQGHPRGGLFP